MQRCRIEPAPSPFPPSRALPAALESREKAPELPTRPAASWSCARTQVPGRRRCIRGYALPRPGQPASLLPSRDPGPAIRSDFPEHDCSSYKFLQPLPQRLIGAEEQCLSGGLAQLQDGGDLAIIHPLILVHQDRCPLLFREGHDLLLDGRQALATQDLLLRV